MAGPRFLTIPLAALVAALAVGRTAVAEPSAWFEGFEGPQPSWRLLGGNAQYHVEFHQRIRGEAHGAEACERLRIQGTAGSEVYFSHDVGYPQVNGELLPTVWVKSDRPGIQLLAQVILPRSVDPRTQRPLSVLLQGSSYTSVGRWQQLRVEDIPQQLRRQTWALRTQFGPGVDAQEAYVDRVLLNVYGGPGATNVWIDDLEIAGYVGPSAGRAERPGAAPMPTVSLGGGASTAVSPPASEGPGGVNTPVRGRLRLVDSVLLVEDRPIFPRIVPYQGEPLARLKQLGFNAIWLARNPTPELLADSQKAGLWVVCPPPGGPQADTPEAAEAPLPEIGPAYDRVLAWDLGSGLGAAQLAAVRRWAERVRTADRRQPGRPMVCWPDVMLREYSRLDASLFLVLHRAPLGTSLELSDYGTWLRERPLLARLGTPIWSTVQTQPPESLRRQWAGLGQSSPPLALCSEQVQLLAFTAILGGSRGLLFESRTSLSADDPDTRIRARTLELLNRQIELIEPWAAAGHLLATIRGSAPGVVAVELQRDHSRLLLPLRSPPSAQHVLGQPGSSAAAGQPASSTVSFVVPGVPETNSAYLMTPGGLQPIRPKRVAGGVLVALEQFDLGSLVLLTDDPKTVQDVSRQIARVGRRIAELQCELAAAELEMVARVSSQLAGRAAAVPEAAGWLAEAKKNLDPCGPLLAAGAAAEASLCARRAMRAVRLVERKTWERAVARLDAPVASPAAVFFQTLPDHWGLMARIAASRPGADLLPGGGFEDLDSMFQAGWQHLKHPNLGIETGAELSAGAAHSGRFGLRLFAHPGSAKDAPVQVESPPVWMVTPPIQVQPGWVLRIQGWVRVPKPITGSVDGLLIVDSLGGEPLAERIRQTSGWRQFTLHRVATQPDVIAVTFALTGLGEAWIDDVTIQPLLPAAAPSPR